VTLAVTVTLSLPPPELRSNWRSRSHWPKTRATKKHRREAHVLTLLALGGQKPMWKDATAAVSFFFADRGYRDKINLNMSLKAAIDGMVDAGLLLDDRWLTMLPPHVGYDKARPRVVIEVRNYKYEAREPRRDTQCQK